MYASNIVKTTTTTTKKNTKRREHLSFFPIESLDHLTYATVFVEKKDFEDARFRARPIPLREFLLRPQFVQ